MSRIEKFVHYTLSSTTIVIIVFSNRQITEGFTAILEWDSLNSILLESEI